MKLALSTFVIILYFIFSWLVPWPEFVIPSYLIFDIAFSIAVLTFMKQTLVFKFKRTNYLESFFYILILAVAAVLTISFFEWQTPFLYISHYEIKLLLAAPIIEELIFRGAFHSLLRKNLKLQTLIITSSAIFSLSHLSSFFTTPNDFHPFIFFQTGYTFILGYFLAKDFEENLNFTRVVSLHFIFNTFFLVAIKAQMIN